MDATFGDFVRRGRLVGLVSLKTVASLACFLTWAGATDSVLAQAAPAATAVASGDATAAAPDASRGREELADKDGPVSGAASTGTGAPSRADARQGGAGLVTSRERGGLSPSARPLTGTGAALNGGQAKTRRRIREGDGHDDESGFRRKRAWGRVGMGLWFLSSPPEFYGGLFTVSLEGGGENWLGGRVVLGAAILPLSSEPLDEMTSFESMSAAVFAVGPVFRISGIDAVARVLKKSLELDVAVLVSVVANRPMVAVTSEVEFDVRYLFRDGWWVGGAIKGGWWHVMTDAVEGNLSLGPAFGVGIQTGWSW